MVTIRLARRAELWEVGGDADRIYLVRTGVAARLDGHSLIVADEGIDLGEYDARAVRLPLRAKVRADGAALAALGWLAAKLDVVPLNRLIDTAERAWGNKAGRSVAALQWGFEAGG